MQYQTIQSEDKQQNQLNKNKNTLQLLKLQQLHQEDIRYENKSQGSEKNIISSDVINNYCTLGRKIKFILVIIFVIFCLYILRNKSLEQQESFPFFTYNQHLEGQVFGNFSDLYITWNQSNMKQYKPLMEKAFYFNQIQVGSLLDFGLTQKINFDQLEKELFKKIAFQYAYFQFNQGLQIKANQISSFNNNQKIQKIIDQLKLNSKEDQKSIEYNLGIQLIKNQNDPKFLEVQYYLANKKYDIGNQKQQKPICIYSSGLNIMSKKDRYLKYFSSMQKLNYTNFHIIFIDDFSEDGSFQEIYKFLRNSSLRIRNRIKLIHNLQRLGILANMNFWIKNFCQSDDIVIVVDADDIIIGRQALKIINSIFSSPYVWYAYSKFILTRHNQKNFQKGVVSTFLHYKTQQYRISFDWQTSAMRSFRRKLLDSIPLMSFIQFRYEKELNVLWPQFYKAGADMFIVHSQLEAAGNHRIVHILDYLYLYYFQDHVNKDCFREFQIFQGYKSKIKTPLKLVSKLGQKASLMTKYKISQKNIKKVQAAYNDYIKCKKQFQKKLAQKIF